MTPSLYNPTDTTEIIARFEKLTPLSTPLWGKMNIAQMFAHCNVGVQTAMGKHNVKMAMIGKLIGRFFKKLAYNDQPFKKNSPTDRTYIFPANLDAEVEKIKVISSIKQFSEGGPTSCTTHPHPFFGKLTAEQWGKLQWKHLDHHLRQFGV